MTTPACRWPQIRESLHQAKNQIASIGQQRDMYKQLATEREAKIQELGGTTRSADAVKSELERREEEKHKLERDIDMCVFVVKRSRHSRRYWAWCVMFSAVPCISFV
jgi:chromosome segregation ATPase